ncbi:MAG: hypothetical protein JWN76_1062 [Chitinophagaceae bacterium]|nr:hypothetical protein [Chitinophagaceae bacterium]
MDAHFERSKNLKALTYTAVITVGILFFMVLVSWTLPVIAPPAMDEGVEINLGNSDQGLGDIAPQIPGEPSAAQETNNNPPPTAAATPVEEVSKEVADNTEPDAPFINTKKAEVKPKIEHKPIAEVKPKNTKPVEVVNPSPAPPKPKAVYKGGTSNGPGGNGADSYNNTRNQGIAGGTGDQGKPNGNPNSDSYKGNGGTGKSGVSIRSGLQGRRLTHLPSFTDDFNENAKVAVDVKVDAGGNVTSALVNPRGTTTTNSEIRSIAVRKALQLKLNAAIEEQTGTIVFDFKLRG